MNSQVTSPEHYGLRLRVVEAGRRPVRSQPQSTIIAEIGREIAFVPDALDTYTYDGWKPIHHDLLVISAAVEYADRRTARRVSRWARDFAITVPVVEVATWQHPEVHASLRAALRHLTGDEWHFTFVAWKGASVLGARQRSLPFGTEKSFVIAYSDGLDSRCVSKVSGKGRDAVCVRVTKHRHAHKAGDEPFDQIPFRVDVPSARESSVRSRGFKFAAVTAIAAHLTGLTRIVVPESGQGALGPVLLPLHNVYADYRNHPTYFRKMERFIRALLGHQVHYEQPRLWNTKGETISAFRLATNKAVEELFETQQASRRNGEHSFLHGLTGLGKVTVVGLTEAEYALFSDLLVGRSSLDDGEAATIAIAAHRGFRAVVDDRKGRARAATLMNGEEPSWSLDLLRHPSALARLGDQLAAEVVYLALLHGRMRIPPECADDVVTLIGRDRARQCTCLPNFKRLSFEARTRVEMNATPSVRK